MNCEICRRVVDPYTEREWLLVAIDCILLRPEAYRHVLYNNQDLSWYKYDTNRNNSRSDNNNNVDTNGNKNDGNNDSDEDENGDQNIHTTTIIHRLVRWTIVSNILHAYLKWETFIQEEQQQQRELQDWSTLLYTIFVITSALDLLAQWLAIYGYMKLVTMFSSYSSSQHKILAYQIFLSLLLPTSFQVVCVSVLIWENSNTTRALGSLLITCWQCLAISLITISTTNDKSNVDVIHDKKKQRGRKLNDNRKKMILPTTVFTTPLFGILFLIVWRLGVSHLLRMISDDFWPRSIPCVGFEVEVDVNYLFYYLSHYINYGYGYDNDFVVSNIDKTSPPILLCLT